MKPLITNELELVGKTIEAVTSRFENVALHFTDGTAAVWLARLQYGEDIYLTLRDSKELDDYTLMDLGAMSREEYDNQQAAKKQQARAAREADERRTFLVLLAKYGAEGFAKNCVIEDWPKESM